MTGPEKPAGPERTAAFFLASIMRQTGGQIDELGASVVAAGAARTCLILADAIEYCEPVNVENSMTLRYAAKLLDIYGSGE